MSKKEIIKKFKELGYQYEEYSDFEAFIDNSNSVVIIIGADKTICKYERDCYCSKKDIKLQEFKLLIELFKWKKWIE